MLSIAGLVCLLAVVATLALAFHGQEERTRNYLYGRCVARAQYDAAAQAERRAEVEWYRAQIRIESGNKFVDETVRQARVRSSQALIEEIERVLAATVPGTCDPYK